MKIYDQEEICKLFTKYVRVNFDSADEAAAYYGVHKSFISNIKGCKAAPNKSMLEDMRFERMNGFIKSR